MFEAMTDLKCAIVPPNGSFTLHGTGTGTGTGNGTGISTRIDPPAQESTQWCGQIRSYFTKCVHKNISAAFIFYQLPVSHLALLLHLHIHFLTNMAVRTRPTHHLKVILLFISHLNCYVLVLIT